MNSRRESLTVEETESDFVRLLREIQENRASLDSLFEHPLFKSKLRLVTRAHASTTSDAEELANDVRIKVWQKLPQFIPDYTTPYGSFFAWLRMLTQHIYLDNFRRSTVEFDPKRAEDLNVADTQSDLEASVLYKEVRAEFEKRINALPDRERLAMAYYLQGFSFREISQKMLQAGFSASHVTVANGIRKGLRAFFEQSNLKDDRSRNVRVTRVRATRAKREFYAILEQAINADAPTITSDNSYPHSLALVRRGKTALSSRPGWLSANHLLKRMQSPESKKAIQAAFDASPEELGRAAVDHATGQSVPVSVLSTSLMAASTVSVVGRVMNLTKDVA